MHEAALHFCFFTYEKGSFLYEAVIKFFTSFISTNVKFLKFLDAKKLCCNLPKIQTKRPNLRVFHGKDANGIANSEDPDQTAPLGAV